MDATMTNYPGPERRRNDDRDGNAARPPVDARTQEQVKRIVRWSLTTSSIVMVTFAALTYLQVVPLPQWTAFLFVAVAAIDTVIAFVVFGPAKQ